MDHVPECRFFCFFNSKWRMDSVFWKWLLYVYICYYICYFFYYFDYFYNFGLRTGDEGDDECSESDKSVHEFIDKVDGNAYVDECKDECEQT